MSSLSAGLLLLLLLVAPAIVAQNTGSAGRGVLTAPTADGALETARPNVTLTAEPRTFRVVAGEAVQVELAVRADSVAPVRFHIPADPLLLLRAVEKPPLQRAPDGGIVHRRVVIWQGLEPGCARLNTITVETRGCTLTFPEITITVRNHGP